MADRADIKCRMTKTMACGLLVEGLTSVDRVAMFGWSYGGYAVSRRVSTPQIYQCVIAGAAVTDPEMQVNYYRYRLRGRSKVEQLGNVGR